MNDDIPRKIEDWDKVERTVRFCRLEEQKPEAWFWNGICVEDRLEAVQRMRREHHGWEAGNEPALERIVDVVEFA